MHRSEHNKAEGGASRPMLQRRKLLLGLAAITTVGAGVWARRAWFDRHYLQPGFNTAEAVTYAVASPNQRLRAEVLFEAAGGATPRWRVHRDERAVLQSEALGLTLADARKLGPGARVIGQQLTRLHEGHAAELAGECNELAVQMLDAATGIIFDVIVRAYDAGVALGYLVRYMPDNESMQPFTTPWRVILPP
jgi:hypothetical protein